MAGAIKVADIFAQIGARVDVRQLNRFQKRLAMVKRQMLDLKRLSASRLSPNTNIAAVRNLNTELARTLRLSRQIQGSGTIRVGGGARAGGRGRGGGGGGVAAGAAGAFGAGKGGFVARNFLGGFTAALAVRQLFQAQSSIEGIRVALDAVAGPAETGADIFKFLREEANRLGFEFSSSALEFAKLQAAGVSAGLATDTLRKIFTSAQVASRVFNLSVADTEGVLKAFTQILSKGKVTAEELRNQLGDRLPAAVPLMAKALGVTTQELSKMLEAGEILANDALPKLADTILEQFAGSIEAASKTTSAALNRFLTAWFFARDEINKGGFGEVIIQALDGLSRALGVLPTFLRFVGAALKIVFSPFNALFRLISRMDDRMLSFGKAFVAFLVILGIYKAALKAAAIVQLSFLAPWLGLIVAIASVLFLFDDLITFLEGGDSLIGRALSNFASEVQLVVDVFNDWIAAATALFEILGKLNPFSESFALRTASLPNGIQGFSANDLVSSQIRRSEAAGRARRNQGGDTVIEQNLIVNPDADAATVRRAAALGITDALDAATSSAAANIPNQE